MSEPREPRLLPLHDNVIVERAAADDKTPSGLFIPAVGQEKPQEATVVAVGPGARAVDGRRLEPSVKKGDRVLLAKWSGSEIKAVGKEYLIVRESEILAVVE
jgi:chaperonin GroES